RDLLVESLRPVRDPTTASGLKKAEPNPWVPLEHVALEQAGHGHHVRNRHGDGARPEPGVEEVLPWLVVHAGDAVDGNRRPQLVCLLEEWLEIPMVEEPRPHQWRDDRSYTAKLRDRSTKLVGGLGGILERNDRDALQPLRIRSTALSQM